MLPLLLMAVLAGRARAAAGPWRRGAVSSSPSKVKDSDIIIPVGDSLRAATWENLPEKPTAARHVALACLVMANEGTPISCLPATPKLKAANLAAWNAEFDAYAATAPATPTPTPERTQTDIAMLRVVNIRLKPERSGKGKNWKTMIFDEVFAPTDARERPPAGEALTMGAVTLEKPFDPDVLRLLYPIIAQRYQVSARVTITCHIEPALTLLCRKPGKIDAEQGQPPANPQGIYAALVFASYQAASTIRLAPTAKAGRPVAGKDLTLAFRWAMPANETPAPAASPAPEPRAVMISLATHGY